MVGGHIATKADVATLDEHKSDVQKQWDVVAEQVSHLHRTASPHCIHLMQLVADTWSVDARARSTRNSFLIAPCKKRTLAEWRKLWSAPRPTGDQKCTSPKNHAPFLKLLSMLLARFAGRIRSKSCQLWL